MPHADAEPTILLAMVPGMGIAASDFHDRGLIAELNRHSWPVTATVIDPGPEAYLDHTIESRMLDAIMTARQEAGASRVWLAGISLGCQAILRCVRTQPTVAEGILLMTPYLASTGLIAAVIRAGGLRPWVRGPHAEDTPEQRLLAWLATTRLPPVLVGHASRDRFADTARLLSHILSPNQMIGIEGAHDWESWTTLWRLMLDRNPFQLQQTAAI
jgi:pimeloyl-ACP methyl ester carboxylesterase